MLHFVYIAFGYPCGTHTLPIRYLLRYFGNREIAAFGSLLDNVNLTIYAGEPPALPEMPALPEALSGI